LAEPYFRENASPNEKRNSSFKMETSGASGTGTAVMRSE
jgi:hypothetical protein